MGMTLGSHLVIPIGLNQLRPMSFPLNPRALFSPVVLFSLEKGMGFRVYAGQVQGDENNVFFFSVY